MTQSPTPPSSLPRPSEEFHLAVAFLREDLQDLRQDIRDVHSRIDGLRLELTERIDGRTENLRTELNQRLDGLAHQLDSRYGRLMATMIAMAGVIVTAVGVMAAVLRP
jgi:hypothetical protein